MKKFLVKYKSGNEILQSVWYAENASECRAVARDDYRQNDEDFKRIISVEEITD